MRSPGYWHSATPYARPGKRARGLFIVKSGSIRVFSADGDKETSLGVRKAGEVFGEMVVLREYQHEWSARASSKTELLFIPRNVIGPIVAANPTARAFVASRVAVSSAGGLISHLFDLRSKVDKSELEELTRSVGVKRVSAGKEILKQGSRGRSTPVCRAPWGSPRRAQRRG